MKKGEIDWLNHGLEFAVVIIGILLAFQLNECATDSAEQKTVKNHLVEIQSETEYNANALRVSINQAESTISKLDSILILINEDSDYDLINKLSIDVLNLGGTYFRKNAFQNLVESGDIRFIEDFKTKQRIINLYEYYKWVETFDEISSTLYMQDYYPYLREHFDLVSGIPQEKSIYRTKLFRNIVGAYRRTSANRMQKYRDCQAEVEAFLQEQSVEH